MRLDRRAGGPAGNRRCVARCAQHDTGRTSASGTERPHVRSEQPRVSSAGAPVPESSASLSEDEIVEIRRRYERRKDLPPLRYSPLNAEVFARVQERQRAMTRLFRAAGISSVSELDILEVGCGTGANLLE